MLDPSNDVVIILQRFFVSVSLGDLFCLRLTDGWLKLQIE